MSDVVVLLIQQVVVMFLLMMTGFVIYKIKMLDQKGVSQLTNVVLYVATPATIINSFFAAYDVQVLYKGAWAAVLGVIMMIINMALTFTVFRKMSDLGKFGIIVSNLGFLGIPLVQMVLGQQAVFYMTMVMAFQTIVTFTYGIYLISHDRTLISFRKVVTNPPIVAVFVGVLIYCLQIPVPAMVQRTVAMIGNINAPLAMMMIGTYLADADLKKVMAEKETYLILAGRLLVAPALALLAFRLVPASMREVSMVAMIAASTPVAGVMAMFSQKYGGDYAYGAGIVSISTILSLITMPLFLALL
ncbi:MAG: AEC family transporter [Solobacterium sp.]|nr:AEC family transporter [Solobacterium sp.]MBQ6356298.1 AEC family transporter [Solobacterium sp.]MBQ6532405.1 AEC family transporter [Solobacterium sp.]MBR0214407.1 AEC family transporter [Solobacterium sp.]